MYIGVLAILITTNHVFHNWSRHKCFIGIKQCLKHQKLLIQTTTIPHLSVNLHLYHIVSIDSCNHNSYNSYTQIWHLLL